MTLQIISLSCYGCFKLRKYAVLCTDHHSVPTRSTLSIRWESTCKYNYINNYDIYIYIYIVRVCVNKLTFILYLFIKGWDRRRRCDLFDYDPPCGVCEGIINKQSFQF